MQNWRLLLNRNKLLENVSWLNLFRSLSNNSFYRYGWLLNIYISLLWRFCIRLLWSLVDIYIYLRCPINVYIRSWHRTDIWIRMDCFAFIFWLFPYEFSLRLCFSYGCVPIYITTCWWLLSWRRPLWSWPYKPCD